MPIMPNVVGVEVPQALASMVTAGVRVVPLGYFQTDPCRLIWTKSTAKPGFITAQAPSSGANVLANSAVVLTVSAFPLSVSNFGGLGS